VGLYRKAWGATYFPAPHWNSMEFFEAGNEPEGEGTSRMPLNAPKASVPLRTNLPSTTRVGFDVREMPTKGKAQAITSFDPRPSGIH
jgi:hypothetical protein